MAFLASAIQGTNAVAYKLAFTSMDPLMFTAMRNIAIGVVLILFMNGFRHLLRAKQLVHIAIHATLGLFVLATLAVGVDLSTAMNTSVISLVLPIFIYIFAILFLHEPALKRVLAGAVIALAGSGIIIGLPVIIEQRLEIGDAILLSSYIGLAAMIVHTKFAYKYLGSNDLLAIRFFASGLVIALYVAAFTDVTFDSVDVVGWWSLLYSIVVTGVLATTLYYYALRFIKAEHTAPIFYIDPLVGVLAAALVLGESLSAATAFGGVIIMAGIVISHTHASRVLHKIHLPSRQQKIRRFFWAARKNSLLFCCSL